MGDGMVSKNHWSNWFAVMVFTSSAKNGRFRGTSVCCGPVYGSRLSLRFGCGPVDDFGLSLRSGSGPVCTKQQLSSRTAKSSTPSIVLACIVLYSIRRFVPTPLYFDIHRLPSSHLLCRLHILDALAASFLVRPNNDGVVFLHLR